jgi:hypothetical protein
LYQGRLKFLTRHYHPKNDNLPLAIRRKFEVMYFKRALPRVLSGGGRGVRDTGCNRTDA